MALKGCLVTSRKKRLKIIFAFLRTLILIVVVFFSLLFRIFFIFMVIKFSFIYG